MEISEAIENNDYDSAIKVLSESKECDAGNTEQLEKYSEQLIEIYHKLGKTEDYIEQSSNRVSLLDSYDKILRKTMAERVIQIYSDYLKQVAEMANERKKYKYLMPYLKKISKCDGGKAVAEDIAAIWRREYKRRTAMMDELRKAGFYSVKRIVLQNL